MTQYFFVSKNNRFYARLALFASILAFIVIALGAYTRLTNAGLSCPDWPVCYGYITAPHTTEQIQQATLKYPGTPVETKKAWTEMVHRYLASSLGLLVIFLVVAMGQLQRKLRLNLNTVRFALVGLLASQVLLGMLTVTMKLSPMIVLGHLLTGLSLLTILWWLYLTFANRPTPVKSHPRWRLWLWLGFIILFMQISLGGWVSTHYAGLACVDFPYCNGSLFPDMQWKLFDTHLITIHMLHRIGALITAVYLGGLSVALLRTNTFKRGAIVLLILLAIQITLGILNIILLLPVHLALTHNIIAALLLLTVVTLLVQAYRQPQEITV